MLKKSLFPAFLFLVLLFCPSIGFAQSSGVAFLRFAPDATSAAMGSANTSASNDAFANYWNPAGLATVREYHDNKAFRNEAAFAHHTWVGSVRTYAGATRFSLSPKSALGVALTATGIANLEARDQPGDITGLFSAGYGAFSLSYGRQVGKNFRVGVTGKYINEQLDTYSANGYAADAGFQLELGNGDVQLGAAVRNIGQMNELSNEATKLPTTIQGGVTLYPFRVVTKSGNETMLSTRVSAEMSRNIVDEKTQLHFGLASKVLDIITLRGGYITNDELRSYSLGLGLLLKWQDDHKGIRFDYAFVPFKNGFGSAGHILTLNYGW